MSEAVDCGGHLPPWRRKMRRGKKASMENRFKKLPAPIKLEDTIAEVDTRDVPDPDGGRNPDRDFMIRNAGF